MRSGSISLYLVCNFFMELQPCKVEVLLLSLTAYEVGMCHRYNIPIRTDSNVKTYFLSIPS